MKRFLAVVLSIIILASFSSCGGNEENTSGIASTSSNEASISGGTGEITSETSSENETKNEVIEKAKKEINANTNDSMSDIQKLWKMYNWLYKNFKYKTMAVDLSNGYTDELTNELALYFFKYHRGSCEHYAAAQKVLCELLGYECQYVEGERYSTVECKFGEHLWLMVKIDGQWYHMDGLYAGNHTGGLSTVFCVPDSAIEKNHRWEKGNYPACTNSQPKYK